MLLYFENTQKHKKKLIIFKIINSIKYSNSGKIKPYEVAYNSMESLIDTFTYKESYKRFKTLLLLLVKNIGIYTKFGIIIIYPLSHQDIAEIIGTNRITINRIINNLNRQKIISIYKRRFILHDPIMLLTIN